MGQVAFDTQEFVETLENAGLPKEQARAISIAVKKSHEVADVATKVDIVELNRKIDDVHNELNHKIEDVRSELKADISDLNHKIEDVRSELKADISDLNHKIDDVRSEVKADISELNHKIEDVRKDMENRFDKLGLQLTVRMGGMLIVAVGALAAMLKIIL